MSINDYIARLQQYNPKIFRKGNPMVQIRVSELEKQIRAAFAAGEKAGREGKSIFEQVFGK